MNKALSTFYEMKGSGWSIFSCARTKLKVNTYTFTSTTILLESLRKKVIHIYKLPNLLIKICDLANIESQVVLFLN